MADPIQLTYEEALEQLQNLVHKLENGEISMDDLSEKVRYASALIQYCKNKLRTTEQELENIQKTKFN